MRKILHFLFAVVVVMTLGSCHKEKPEAIVSNAIDIQENAITILNSQGALGLSYETLINNCIQQLMQNPDVATAKLQDADQIIIRYKSGVTGVIFIVGDDKEQKSFKTNPSYSKPINRISKGKARGSLITNHKVLIWEAWGDEGYPIADELDMYFRTCPDVNLDVTKTTGTNCTVQSLCDLTKYGFVYIHTHGGCFPNAQGEEVCWILTREKCSQSKAKIEELKKAEKIVVTIANVKKEYGNNQEITLGFHNKGHYFGVSTAFFSENLSGSFNGPSIVFVQACHSFENKSLRNVFINEKNASVYLGYTNTVSKKFGREVGLQFVFNMLYEKLSAYNAYDELDDTEDPYLCWISDALAPSLHEPAELDFSFRGDPTYFESDPNPDPGPDPGPDPNPDESYGILTCDNLGISLPITYFLRTSEYFEFNAFALGGNHATVSFSIPFQCQVSTLGDYYPRAFNYDDYFFSNDPIFFTHNTDLPNTFYSYVTYSGGYGDIVDGVISHPNTNSFIFWFDDENGNRWQGTYNGPVN